MDKQYTFRLPDDLSRALTEASRKMERKSAEIVRMALRQYLQVDADERKPVDRVRSLIGALESGTPDLAERHRDYVLQALQGQAKGKRLGR